MQKFKVQHIKVTAASADQRIDNYLIKILKGVPKSRIYRIIRKGEVRVNKKRIDARYKLQMDDEIRIPPVSIESSDKPPMVSDTLREFLLNQVLYEDEGLIVFHKPAGMSVHGGQGLAGGVIDRLRVIFPEQRVLELVHRLDKETSGCLLIAKKRATLVMLHEKIRSHEVEKYYITLVAGRWPAHLHENDAPLQKQILQSGERMVKVSSQGSKAITQFKVLQRFQDATLLQVKLLTGRTHQIRVHCQHAGHPIAGDDKYGDKAFNKKMKTQGLKRMFLHAQRIAFKDTSGKSYDFIAPLCAPLEQVLNHLIPYP